MARRGLPMTVEAGRPLPVPQRYRAGLVAVSALSDEEFTRLVAELGSVGPTLDPLLLVKRLTAVMPKQSAEKADSVVKSLLSVVLLTEALELGPDEVAERISHSHDLELVDGTRSSLQKRIRHILGMKTLITTAKGVRLLSADDKTFHDVRVITDVRPVFVGDVSRGPTGALIVHSLIVEYHESSADVRQVTFSLDSTDVERLLKALERANAKADALNAMLDKAGVAVLRLEGEKESTNGD